MSEVWKTVAETNSVRFAIRPLEKKKRVSEDEKMIPPDVMKQLMATVGKRHRDLWALWVGF